MQMSEQKALYQMNLTPGIGFITGPEGEKAAIEVIRKDKDCSYRIVVNIVGRERQGKTSLRKLLSNEDFDEEEESTVGVDHELVDTVGIEPDDKRHWSKTDMREANSNEYDEIVGKHVKIRLDNVRSKTFFATIIICSKIAIMTLIAFAIYTCCIYCESLHNWPWFGMLMCFMFFTSTPVLGIQDGTGVAAGVRHLVVLVEAWFRWQPVNQFLKSETLFAGILVFCGAVTHLMILEAFESVLVGLSLGVGVACCFSLCSVPESSMYASENPFFSLEVHVFHIGCIIGLLMYNYCNYKLLSALLLIMAVLLQFNPGLFLTMIISVSIGTLHNFGLKLAQNSYGKMDYYLKRIGSSVRLRRLLRHCLGLSFGLISTRMFGWQFAPNLSKLTTVFALITLMEILKLVLMHNLKRENVSKINKPSKVVGARTRSPRLKLLVRDFAGHPLYYTAHQLYMTGQCVYLLVFSLVEAIEDFDRVSQDIHRWLRSIQIHSQAITRVFLVGSHRDDPLVVKEKMDVLKEKLRVIIPRSCQNIIVWNQDESPLFPVENSSRDEMDDDHKNLKDKIIEKSSEIIKLETFPVKFFYFFSIIEIYRAENVLFDTFINVYNLCFEMKLAVATESEFEDMLIFFNKMGEIMYRNDDDELKKLIIFDPRSLLNILGHLINVPRMCDRPSDLISDWTTLQENGVCSEKLFNYVFQSHSPPGVSRESILLALIRFHLICKLGESSYIISSALPSELPYPEKCWPIQENDQVFYIKSQPHFPEELFLYLTCACAELDTSTDTTDSSFLNISRYKAIFNHGNELCYQLTLCKDGKCLQIAIRGDERTAQQTVLSMIWKCLWKIVRQDFKMCNLSLGYLCPYSPPHEGSNEENHLLLLNTSSCNEQEILTFSSRREFWCIGRKITVIRGRPRVATKCAKRDDGERKLEDSIRDKRIMGVPHHIYQSLCTSLNVPNPLGRDWTMLAGLLDLTVRDVEIIRFKHPDNPCSAVFKTWCVQQPDVTLSDLIQYLEEMERADVIQMIENEEF